MTFVLDSSVTLAWCFEDERTDATDALLRQITVSGAAAPGLWPLEVLNGLAMGERRGRLDATQRQKLIGFLCDLPVSVDDETALQAWSATAALAARFQRTVYDAAYLELAQRLSLPLATLDRALRAAAGGLGVRLLGDPRAMTDAHDRKYTCQFPRSEKGSRRWSRCAPTSKPALTVALPHNRTWRRSESKAAVCMPCGSRRLPTTRLGLLPTML